MNTNDDVQLDAITNNGTTHCQASSGAMVGASSSSHQIVYSELQYQRLNIGLIVKIPSFRRIWAQIRGRGAGGPSLTLAEVGHNAKMTPSFSK